MVNEKQPMQTGRRHSGSKKETGRQEEQVRSVHKQSQKSEMKDFLQGGEGGRKLVKRQRMNKKSQDGNLRGPGTSRGEKTMYPEPLYKYHLKRGVDDGKRKGRNNRRRERQRIDRSSLEHYN